MSEKLQDQRLKLVADQRQILKRADDEGRGMTVDEMASFDKIDADIVNLKATIDRTAAVEAHDAHTSELRVEMAAPVETRTPETVSFAVEPKAQHGRASDEYREAFTGYLRGGRMELRALQEGTASEGGYLVPDQWASQLQQARQEANIMRQIARVITTESGTFNLPTVSSEGSAAWTQEENAFTESDTAFGNVTYSAYKAGTIMKVTDELLADNSFDLTSYITQEFGRRIGTLEEAAFVDGNGSNKPTGVVNGSTLGVTAASATAITADELIDLFHKLAPQYRPFASWLMKDDTIKLVRKLTDSNGQYIWQPGLQASQPDTLLGRPVYASSSMPGPSTANKSVLFGDMSYYWIADRAGFSMQRLDELYAANGFIGFRASARTDGKLTLATAVYHLVQA